MKKRPKFWRNVSIVMLGTLMYQALPLAVLPLITRVLEPAAMGSYFTWLSAVVLAAVLMSFRLDMAIFQAEDRECADTLLSAAFCGALVLSLSLLVLGLCLYLPEGVSFVTVISPIHFVSFVVASFSLGVNLVVNALYAREAQFKTQAKWKMVFGGLIAFLQVLLALSLESADGLIIAHAVAALIITTLMLRDCGFTVVGAFSRVRRGAALSVVGKYRRFPVLSLPAALVNTAAQHLPIFLIGAKHSAASSGFYGLTYRSLAAPVGLVGGSITSVFREEVSRSYRDGLGCIDAYHRTLRALVLMGGVPFLVIGLAGESIFSIVFGSEWGYSGRLAQYLAPLFYIKFVASPLSYMFFVANRQAFDLIWQCGLLVVAGLVFVFIDDIEWAVIAFSVLTSLLYLGNLYYSWRLARSSRSA